VTRHRANSARPSTKGQLRWRLTAKYQRAEDCPGGCTCAKETNSWSPSTNSARTPAKRWWYRHHRIPTVSPPDLYRTSLYRTVIARRANQRPRQWEQVPVISITDTVCRNPAFLAMPARNGAIAAVEASPTDPQLSHIRNATIASLSWLWAQAI
jgi:hypothetical protein